MRRRLADLALPLLTALALAAGPSTATEPPPAEALDPILAAAPAPVVAHPAMAPPAVAPPAVAPPAMAPPAEAPPAMAPPAMVLPAEAPPPLFVDAGAEVGLDFHHFNGATGELHYVEMMGPGGGLLDYDNDGDLDLYLVQGAPLGREATVEGALSPPRHPLPLSDRLYRNDLAPGPEGAPRVALTDVTEASGLAALAREYGAGVATGDYDNDGWLDLYLLNYGPNRLLRNRGAGADGLVTFEEVTAVAGVGERRWSIAASFFDADNDGWLDLYVVNYVDFSLAKHKFCPAATGGQDYCGPRSFEPESDRLFWNRATAAEAGGAVSFQDVSGPAGIGRARGPGMGVVATDFDADGRPDLYVTNDEEPNFLWLAQGPGEGGVPTYRDEALLAGVAVNADGVRESSMGVTLGDADGDGDDDLFLTHLNGQTNTLYTGDERGLYGDASEPSGLGNPSWTYTGFGTVWLDFDLDGDLDLYVANGAVRLWDDPSGATLAQRNQLFRNRGDGRFDEVPAEEAGAVFALAEVSRGVAVGDVDNDGDPDLLLVNNDGPARLLLNQRRPAAGEWLGLRLVGGAPPRDQLGARVALHRSGAPSLWRRVATDGSYSSASDPRLLFGLAGGGEVESVEVVWPGGERELFTPPPTGRYTTLTRGSGRPPSGGAPVPEDRDEGGR